MTNPLKKAWAELVQPLLRRPERVQVAALCYRPQGDGKEILLITSRDTGRWILPKGWPIDGMDGPEAALQEAWEEAGVESAEIRPVPVGQYVYAKAMDSGGVAQVRVQVYLTRVKTLSPSYPDAGERSRKWVTPTEAAAMVDEPDLAEILRRA